MMARICTRGGRSGRGGRGRGRNNRNLNTNAKREKEYKFKPHGSGRDKQAVSFGKLLETITIKVKKDYGMNPVIGKRLKDRTKMDFELEKPYLKAIGLNDADGNPTVSKQDEVAFDKDYDMWRDKKMWFEREWGQVYAHIYQDYCTTAMEVALQELPNFEEEIEDDPLKLLESIGPLMHAPMRALYSHMRLIEAIAKVVNMRQYENEDKISYIERFKQERQILRSPIGRGCLDYFIKNTSEYKEENEINKKEEILEDAFEVFTSTIF